MYVKQLVQANNKTLLSTTFVLGIALVSASIAAKQGDPKLTEEWRELVKVDTQSLVPSDAKVLLSTDVNDQFVHWDKSPVKWSIDNGVMTVAPGTKGIMSKEKFCDAQIHIEWRTPKPEQGQTQQHNGNSGVYIQGRYEIQVLNSFDNETYANGQAAAIYKQHPPLVNASRPTEQWQSYDIIFKAPKFSEYGALEEHAYVTVLHNGVVVQNHSKILGSTTYIGAAQYKAHGCAPIHLQDHGSLVSYRNIWVRQL